MADLMLIRRSRTAAAQPLRRTQVAPVEKPQPTKEVPATKLRQVTTNNAAARERMQNEARKVVEAELKLISKAEHAIDLATAQISLSHERMKDAMFAAGLQVHECATDYGQYIAEIVEQWTKQSRTIDPQKFRNKVTNDVFWGCIGVMIGAAKEHLTEKEINDLSDVVPSQFVGRNLKVQKVEPKRRKK